MPHHTRLTDTKSQQICIIGAGFSGIGAAIQLIRKLGISSFTIFEKNDEVGGNWLVNTYPGCACDIQSHLYSYSFEPNPDWSRNFAPQPEILNYIKKTAAKYNLYSHIRFSTQIESLTWDDMKMKWKVCFTRINSIVQEEQYDIVINASGYLHTPNIPKQFLSFEGPIIHSAKWDPNLKLDQTMNVAVIGSGSSAVQIIPSIATKVKQLHVYQRKPAWIWPRSQFTVPDILKWIFAYIPLTMWLYRCFLYWSAEFLFTGFQKDTLFHYIGGASLGLKLRAQVFGARKYEDLVKDLTPNYEFGCKRISVSGDYYPAFTLPNVCLHRKPILEVTSDSICTDDGRRNYVDVIILATGFKAEDYFAPMSIRGLCDEDILHTWKNKGPRLYFGTMSSSTPNLFTLLGPQSQLGHNSLIFQMECQVNLMILVIGEMTKRKASKVAVKTSAVDNQLKEMQRNMTKTVWDDDKCGTWYKDSRGEVTAMWPSSSTYFWMKTRKIDFSHFQFS